MPQPNDMLYANAESAAHAIHDHKESAIRAGYLKQGRVYPGRALVLALPELHAELIWGALQEILTPEQFDKVLDYLIKRQVHG